MTSGKTQRDIIDLRPLWWIEHRQNVLSERPFFMMRGKKPLMLSPTEAFLLKTINELQLEGRTLNGQTAQEKMVNLKVIGMNNLSVQLLRLRGVLSADLFPIEMAGNLRSGIRLVPKS